jgi:hypothetical protein
MLVGSGCAEPPLAAHALPELAAARPAAIQVQGLRLRPGERMTWDVRFRGISIGRAELTVSAEGVSAPSDVVVSSRFRTNDLASSIMRVSHDLTTMVDGAALRPRSSVDTLTRGPSRRTIEVSFGAGIYRILHQAAARRSPDRMPVHTVHTGLGWMRDWASRDARPGHIHVLHGSSLYRIEMMSPLSEPAPGGKGAALRVDCHALPVDGKGDEILLTVWLSDDERRAPLRLDGVIGEVRVLAELID